MQPETKDLPKFQSEILELLKNAQNGIKRHDLQMYMFFKTSPNNDRRIRRAIKGLRDKGFVIVSSSDHSGYKLTTNQDEVKHYVNEQIKRAKACMRTARKVREAYQMRDQLTIGLSS